MKTLTLPAFIIGLCLVISSCSKDTQKQDIYQNPANATDITSLTINSNFDWSSSIKGKLNVAIKAPEHMYTEGQWVELYNSDDQLLDRKQVKNGLASFNVAVPQTEEGLYVYYPNTQEKMNVPAKGNVSFELANVDFSTEIPDFYKMKKASPIKGKTNTSGSNLLLDGDFENVTFASDTRAYNMLRNPGMWYSGNSYSTIKTVGGSKVFSSTQASLSAKISQSISINGNEKFDFAYQYGGNGNCYILFFNQSQKYVGYTLVSKTSSSEASVDFLAPSTVKYIQIYGLANGNDWIDNVNLAQVDEPDADGDGVPDRLDAWPNDPSKSYAGYFPTIGRQIIAFEDLWPFLGDGDFNDLVVSNQMVVGLDSVGKAVDATFSIKVLAQGAGLPNGFAVQLLQNNHTPFGSSLISSVSGDAQLDPDVQNGLIIFKNVKTALNPVYKNNGQGPDGAPQEFTFTITFNNNLGTTGFIPDFYMFKTNDRGKEIHLSGFPGSAAANTSYYNNGQDYNGTYKTANGIPWAIEVLYPSNSYFHQPLENINICAAYPYFQKWAESNGNSYQSWMLYPAQGKVYTKY